METVSLEATVTGPLEAPAVVILHGLLGSARNWTTILQRLEADFRCHALDLRNHGRSPHVASMAYRAMAADVGRYLDAQGLASVALLGHSMGGKVAMTVACSAPSRVSHLAVLDIAPRPYGPRWEREFAAMRALDVARLRSRGEAEAALEPVVKDWAFRKFLLTNLVRQNEGGFAWAVNLPLLERCLPELFAHPLAPGEAYPGPTLFLRGEKSRFVLDEDLPAIRHHFPAARLETLSGAGHNVHFDQPEAFVAAIRRFLGEGG
jgi:esterase